MTDSNKINNPNPVTTTPQQMHQEMLAKVQDQLTHVTGEVHQVEPFTPDSSMEIETREINSGDSINQFYERAILAKPGAEPSKSFFDKLKDRLRKKQTK
jgi:hypothetical protein